LHWIVHCFGLFCGIFNKNKASRWLWNRDFATPSLCDEFDATAFVDEDNLVDAVAVLLDPQPFADSIIADAVQI